MKRLLLMLALLAPQTPSGTPFRIEKLDPSLDEIIAPDAQLEMHGRAAPARLRHEHRVRRRGRSRPLHHRVHSSVQD